MHKLLPIPDTLLVAPFLYGDYLLRLPATLYNNIATNLGAGDWTYLKIAERGKVEIVRVFSVVSLGVVVNRAVDNTQEVSFGPGAVVSYADTVAAILDDYLPPALNLIATNGMELVGSILRYKPIYIDTLGATEIIGDDAGLIIGRKENAYGGCNYNSKTPAPLPT